MPNHLREILDKKHLTYQELSIKVQGIRGEGVSEGTLTKIIKHDHYPTPDTRAALSIALDVSEEEIWPK